MKTKIPLILTIVLIFSAARVMAQATAFTFSGTLQDNGQPANGSYDLTFQLFDASSSGAPVSSILSGNGITVSNGGFSVILDFGDVFNGASRWMELTARTNGIGGFVLVSPRQPITAVASALVANKAVSLVNDTLLRGSIVNPTFVGTTNSIALDLSANGQRGLRLQGADDPSGGSAPNLIGGTAGNFVAAGKVGATIAGGGTVGFTNRVMDSYGTVGGGLQNRAEAYGAVVSGGQQNTASGQSSAISGGYGNQASGNYSVVGGNQNLATNVGATIPGGSQNKAYGLNSFVVGGTNTASGEDSSVVGGANNTVSARYATVAGGFSNVVTGDYSFAAGRRAQANHKGSFVWGDSTDAVISSTTSNQFVVRASGGAIFQGALTANNFIGSGAGLTNIGTLGLAANSVGNTNVSNGAITAPKIAANQVVKSITALSTNGSSLTIRDDVILRGGVNIDVIASSNIIQITSTSNGIVGWATGGNVISSNDFLGTIVNEALDLRVNNTRALRLEPTTGTANVIGGAPANGSLNSVFGATIAGGGSATEPNRVSGNFATVAGGGGNVAGGNYSLAAGRRAKANHNGSMVLADSTPADFASTANDQLLIRAANGVGINTNSAGAGIALNVNGTFKASSYAPGQIVKSIVAVGNSTNTFKDDVRFMAGANISIVASTNNTIQISANSPGNIGWGTEGNIGTTTNNFLGTADNQSLELRVNSSRALRIEPSTNSPNLIGGSPANFAAVNVAGATISGGGNSTNINRVTANFGTVPGGAGNLAAGDYSLAAGNRAKANHAGAFVWADASNSDFASTGTNQFLIRADGGVGIGTNRPASALHVVGTVTADVFRGAIQGSVSGTFTGDGQALTNLNASNLSSGTVPDARLGTNIARLNGNVTFAGTLSATTINATTLNATSFTGSVNATNITSGTVPDSRLSTNIARLNTNAAFSGSVTAVSFSGNLNATNLSSGTVADARLSANIPRLNGNATFAGAVNAASLSGSGANVSNLNADNLATGTVSDARLSDNVPRLNSGAAFSGAVSGTSVAARDENAQSGMYVLRQHTTDAVTKEMLLVVPENTTIVFDGLIAARAQSGGSAGFQIRGIIANRGGTNAFIGTPVVVPLNTSSVKAAVAARPRGLCLWINGSPNGEINWAATVRTSEVSF